MILVAGATGSLGTKICHALLERGDTVRALVRTSSPHYRHLQQAGAEIVFGDLTRPGSLRLACDGVDVLITTATMSKSNDDTVENVDLQGNFNLIDAARAAGVRHCIFVSTIGAVPESPLPLFRAKAAAAQHLRDSGMTFTVVEPAVFMDVWIGMLVEMPAFADQPVTLVGESRCRHSFVAERDVAAFIVASIRNAAAHNATLVIGGPDAITFRSVVRAYEEALGREIEVRSVEPGEPLPGLPDMVSQMAAVLESFETVVPMDRIAREFGVQLTSIRDFANERVRQIAQSAS